VESNDSTGDVPSSLGELLLAFSRVTSAGLGLGTDHGLRTCYVSAHIGADLELSPENASALYYAALAKDGGCVCGASQMAAFLGSNEHEAIADLVQRDATNDLEMLRWLFRHAGRGAGPASRARRTLAALIHGARFDRETSLAECEVAQSVAVRLGYDEEATLALGACSERWDGKGLPRRLKGEAIPLVARIVNLGAAVEIAERFSDRESAIELVRRGSGRAFDPQVAEAFLALAQHEEFWDGLGDPHIETRVLALEPADRRLPGGAEALDRFTEVLADLVDFKRPATAGHSRRVAERSRRIGERLGVSGADLVTLRHAALIHDVGLIAISSHDLAAGRDDAGYRAHPLAPGRLLGGVRALQPACELAALHHERVDGSGWPAGAAGSLQSMSSRILTAACALDEAAKGDLAAELSALPTLAARPGFDSAVLAALAADLGAARITPPARPAGLSEREVEVLRLGAMGLSVREIARRLVISEHTARHHFESVYAKIGCSTRAAAALFAAEHGLLD